MEFSVQIEGLDRIANATKKVQQDIDRELKIALFAAGKKVEREAKISILDGSKSGRFYKRRNVTHRASAPGEAPASDTGRLANSITTYLNRTANEAVITAGRGLARYAPLLEFGTSKIAPRPFMFPALEKSKEWIRERLNAAVRKAVSK